MGLFERICSIICNKIPFLRFSKGCGGDTHYFFNTLLNVDLELKITEKETKRGSNSFNEQMTPDFLICEFDIIFILKVLSISGSDFIDWKMLYYSLGVIFNIIKCKLKSAMRFILFYKVS